MRSFELAKFLVRAGCRVDFVIGGNNPIHKSKIQRGGGWTWYEDGVRVRVVGLINHGSGSRGIRFLSWFQFALKILLLPLRLRNRPDVIIYSSLSLPGVLSSVLLAKYYNARHIFEVRDIWPLTMQHLLKLGRYHPLVMLLSIIEWIGYQYSDLIVTSMPGGINWVRRKMGSEKKQVYWIPNGVDLRRFLGGTSPNCGSTNVSVVYVGSIGQANSVITLVEAAEILRHKREVVFKIYGDGPECEKLKKYVETKKLCNVFFGGNVEQSEVAGILHSADLLYHGSNDSELYEFGISPNKMAEYLASGRPILNSYSGGFDPVSEGRSGLTSRAGDKGALASNILRLAEDPSLRQELGAHAFLQARAYSYESVNSKYLELIEGFK